LVTGGWVDAPNTSDKLFATTACRIFDNTHQPGNKWRPVGTLSTGRSHFTATLLQDGRVLVAGGYSEINGAEQILNSIEIYDPQGKNWTNHHPAMRIARFDHTATLLNDGSVLITGGDQSKKHSFPTDVRERYDPINDTWENWTPKGPIEARAVHTTTILDLEGTVVVTGGVDKDG
ncbi:MAG: hypothetical protein JXA42_15015, partial [Anaerolineales bacterium]|nr:hypothetical protein [Anaerolineales bacterium]